MIMVSERKKAKLKEVLADIEKYPVIGIVDMHNLPARQLHQIKSQLRGKAVIRMVKKRIMTRALEQSKKKNVKGLQAKIQNQPALLFSEANPFELAQVIAKSVSKAAAKEGDTAPNDIVVPAGPTVLPPGPAIGELQKVKIPAGVEGDKIVVKKDTKVAAGGEVIGKDLAQALAKLGIEPIEISLNLLAVWDGGTVFGKDILFIPPEHYVTEMKSAYSNAFNLAMSIDYLAADTLPPLLSKAHRQAVSLAMEAGIVTSETVKSMLAKAHGQASALSGMVKEEVPAKEKHEEKPVEAPKEEEKAEEPKEKPEGGGEKGAPSEERAEERAEDSKKGKKEEPTEESAKKGETGKGPGKKEGGQQAGDKADAKGQEEGDDKSDKDAKKEGKQE
jgi:large subunit ribosomal protein L10